MKVVLEKYWNKNASVADLISVSEATQLAAWTEQQSAGIASIGLDGTMYDQMLDTTTWLGVIPARFQALTGLDRYFAMARGAEGGITALDMSKYLDTNYHYMVPELEAGFVSNPDFSAVVDKVTRAQAALGVAAAVPILIGPLTFVSLARGAATSDVAAAVRTILPSYTALLQKLRQMNVPEVQIHEPYLTASAATGLETIASEAYAALAAAASAADPSPSISLSLVTFYDDLGANYPWVVQLPVASVTLDFLGVPGSSAENCSLALLKQHGFPSTKTLGAGVVDGRSVWADQAGQATALLSSIRSVLGASALPLSITSSCSLQHLPYNVALETSMEPGLKARLGFAVQKLKEIVTLAAASATAADTALVAAPVEVDMSVDASLFLRPETYAVRRDKQMQFHPYPTTTIGSFPQTAEVRRCRLQYKQGKITEASYREQITGHIAYAIGVQEGLGLDVLVHGESERSDMVEYFGQSLGGMLFTEHGWVQSYGSRYVRPPLIVSDIVYKGAITVREFKIAQSLTPRPVKGMLTGPVTILNWSFPRKDISRKAQAMQLGLAIRQEVAALEAAGCRIIQVDEPALREGLPLKAERWNSYLTWAVDSFRLAVGVAAPATQIVTHLCYSDFQDILPAIEGLDADVLTIENSRSDDAMVRALASAQYVRDIGPGVYDVHSPVVPTVEFMVSKMREFQATGILAGRPECLWVNPDCGLKTRAWSETIASLKNMVEAAAVVRREVQAATGTLPEPMVAEAASGEACACCV
ncbi:MAG: hypothetical protein WDW38_011293 [Sanguina aurantia]